MNNNEEHVADSDGDSVISFEENMMDNNLGYNLVQANAPANVVLKFLLADRSRITKLFTKNVLETVFERMRHTFQPVNSVEFQFADNGEQAVVLVALDVKSYNCILLGHEMPALSGPEATLELRNMGFQRLIYGVAFTEAATAQPEFMDAGANGYFQRPLTEENAEAIIRRLINNRHY